MGFFFYTSCAHKTKRKNIGGSNGRENRSKGYSSVLARSVDCFHTVVIHRHLVVELRAVWRCMVYDGSVAGCERVSDVSTVLDVSVADFWREKHDGVVARWRNNGGWWLLVVCGLK